MAFLGAFWYKFKTFIWKKCSKSKQTKYSGFVKLGVRWAEQDIIFFPPKNYIFPKNFLNFFAIQGVVQCMIDLKLFKNMKKEVMTGTLCGFCFVVSLCFAQSVGGYVFTIFDDFSGNIPLLLIALFEVIGVVYFYGLRT